MLPAVLLTTFNHSGDALGLFANEEGFGGEGAHTLEILIRREGESCESFGLWGSSPV
jgi:hypothetical protein